MKFDYSKLKGKIKEKCNTQGDFCEKIGLSERTVSLKLNGARMWKNNEIISICLVLDIPLIEIPKYFFTQKV